MNPSITGADQFSNCSLNSISPVVDRASCLVPVSTPTPPPPTTPTPPEPAPAPAPAPAPVERILSAGFNTGNTRGFEYRANPWGLGNRPQYQAGRLRAKGGVTGGALSIILGGVDDSTIRNMSAGYQRTFNLESTENLTVSFKAVLRQSPNYESDEVSKLFASFNGQFLGSRIDNSLASISGDGNGGRTRSTGFKTYRFQLNSVPAGQHTLIIGGFNGKKTQRLGNAECIFTTTALDTSSR